MERKEYIMRKRNLKILSCIFAATISIGTMGISARAYNGTDAAIYAIRWAESYNTNKYYNAGLDCTNFASQCLVAGGKKISSGSASGYNDMSRWKPHLGTWENANKFKRYWKERVPMEKMTISGKTYSQLVDMADKVYLAYWSGDIIQYSYDNDEAKHSQVVHGMGIYDGHRTLKMAQHSGGQKNILLLEYLRYTDFTKMKCFKFNNVC